MLAERIKIITQRLGVALTTSVLLSGAIGDARAATQGIIGTAFESTNNDVVVCLVSSCRVYFPAIPAGKVVRVERAACNVFSRSPLIGAFLSPYSSNTSTANIKPSAMKVENTFSSVSTNLYYHTVVLEAPLFIGSGRFPGIALFQLQDGEINIYNCVMSGTVISG